MMNRSDFLKVALGAVAGSFVRPLPRVGEGPGGVLLRRGAGGIWGVGTESSTAAGRFAREGETWGIGVAGRGSPSGARRHDVPFVVH